MEEDRRRPTPMERFEKEKERREKENFDILLAQLNHLHLSFRVKAAEALGNIGDERAVEYLERTITPESESDYLYVAMLSLGRLGSPGSVPLLISFLKSDEKWVRLGAVRASTAESLAKIGCTEAMDFISPLLSDDDSGVRDAARKSLAELKKLDLEL